MTSSPRITNTPGRFPARVFVGLVLFAFTLRGPFVVISTVAGELRAEAGMSAATIGLLTSLPVLCFGLAAPVASWVIARLGIERSLLLSVLGTLVGVLVRSIGGTPAALVGTFVIGLAITIGNIVSTVLIGRSFRGRVAVVTGAYTAALNVGSMITLAATGPLINLFGWQVAIATWAVLPLIAGAWWIPLARRARKAAEDHRDSSRTDQKVAPTPRPTSMLRRPSSWMLMAAFAGQAFAYYGVTAWLPTLLADERGMTRDAAGVASSIFQVCAVIGAFATPVVINRFGGPLAAFLVNGLLWSTMPLGLLLAPGLWAVWSALAGAAQGGGFVVIFTVVVMRAPTMTENRQLSAMVQTGGYTVASTGPVVVGLLHEGTGSWDASMLAVLAAITALTVLGALACRGVARPPSRSSGPGQQPAVAR